MQTQFTPGQMLEAGRRAEIQGHPDQAVHIYRFLVEQHPQSIEGSSAQEALRRLSAPRRHEADPATRPPAQTPPTAPRARDNGALPNLARDPQFRAANGHVPMPPAPALAPRGLDAREHPPQAAPRAAPLQPVPAVIPQAANLPSILTPHVTAPAVPHHYGVGRTLAWIITVIGAATMIGSFALSGLVIAGLAAVLGPFGALGLYVLIGGAVSGTVMLMFGQIALAIFDTANATQDTARMLRASLYKSGKP
jgi:hypothetical protein